MRNTRKSCAIRISLFAVWICIAGAYGDQTALMEAYSTVEDHIKGVTSLTVSEINAQATIINSNKGNAGDNAAMINASFNLVETYETEKGALFINGTTSGGFSRTDKSTLDKALAHAMIEVYQAIVDDAYNTWNLTHYRNALNGARFVSADYFPGEASPPADSNAVYSVQINASQPKAWGYPVSFMEEPARRPTGAYLAPGSIATVTVPEALVGKGFEIRVGAHVADLSNRPNNYKRFNRVSLTYPINSTMTEIASPLGGGIYIEVPYEEEEGVVTVEIRNTIRAPFYSNSSVRQTTLLEWQDTERHHPGPWADFETDKFMLNVPSDWIYAYNDPVTLMANWDKAMDACSDLQGLPRVRPKTVLYCQIDVTLDANVFSPGYPQSNDNYDPRTSAGGNKSHDYLNGPKYAGYHHLHEFGHAAYITKFTGELESLVNLFYVPVHHRMFNVSLDEAFGRSIGNYGSRTIGRDQAALGWILSENFQAGNAMDGTNTSNNQMKYQHRGYGKYVEIAGLFGWDALSNFWHSVAVDYENGIEYSRNYDPADSRILRMSRAAGVDLTPLIHFWGIHPVNASSLKAGIAAEGLQKSALIYDRLVRYQTIVPMDATGFEAHYQAYKSGIKENTEGDRYEAMRTGWNQTLGELSVSRVQDILDEYFPNGRPASGDVQSLPYAESFESGIGEWVQSVSDDLDWTVHSGPTDTGNTGPVGAPDGSQYLYLECHDSSVQYKTAMVECSFNLSFVETAEMTFDYHMYGTQIDYLSVDVYDGSTWTSNVWNRTGQQHTSSEQTWSKASIDLSAFAGNAAVTVRFRGKQKQWHAADMAIDDVRVEGTALTLPYAESFEDGFGAWQQSTNDDLDWTRNNGGTDTASTGPSSASDGNQYLYVENHDSGVQYKTTSVECSFDFSSASAPELSFDYHMYGFYIDYLSVDVYEGSTWTSNVWQHTGQVQSSSEDAWSNAVVDLSAYAGSNTVILRFRSKQKQWHAADTAIDNIRVEDPGAGGYTQWAVDAFSGAPVGTDQSETGNPDGDRFSNKQEWALVMDPLIADEPAADTGCSNSNFRVIYNRRLDTGVSVYASWATSLTSTVWRLHGDGLTEETIKTLGDVETRAAQIPLDGEQKFIRIGVEN